MTTVLSERQKALLLDLKKADIVLFGSAIREKYGLGAPVYLDLRENLYRRPELIWRIGEEFARRIQDLSPPGAEIQHLVGVPDTATPLALAASLFAWKEQSVPRLEFALLRHQTKLYQEGRPSWVIGNRTAGLNWTLVDDVMASGLSKWKAIVRLRVEGILVKRILVFIDRQQGGADLLAREGYPTESVFRLTDIMDFYLREKEISRETYEEVCRFLTTHRFEQPLWEGSGNTERGA